MNVTKETSADPDVPLATLTPLPEGGPFRVSAEIFEKMIETEVFADDRVGLWDGQISKKRPWDHVHHMLPTTVMYALMPRLPSGWITGGENLIHLGRYHLPLIDRSVFRGKLDDYRGHWPRPDEVGLIVEYSHSSLKHDIAVKLAGYGGAGIPSYWRLDLAENLVHAYQVLILADRWYDSMRTCAIGQSVPLRLDGVLVAEIPAEELLPVRRGTQPPGNAP